MLDADIQDRDVLSTIDAIGRMDFQTFLNDAGHYVKQQTEQRWARAVDPDETPWSANTGDYKDWKQEHYPGAPPLTLTGELRHRISVYLVAGPMAEVGISDGFHQKIPEFPFPWEEPRDYALIVAGLESGERGNAPRQIFGLNERDIEETFRRFCNAVEKVL
jgi:hypothetical protein